ncbi:sigma-54 interaction domain-containing protein [Desulfobaculum bizertense]|uniref:Transcriptional regulator containing PAS, AAA-type ATPase, and DNA-binding Fis domains n=1 Tax=Desulfobaculum bizertense DSM 18034 TaxID=1121442 RepID=A0A1T4W5M0_9BACT|nr:sigma 54-interacting transcriptional regulator [Desulfobaculum bizertense]UIJ38632.1 sigma 54-interacting transcriptional regulator [Desulfobaculum bizertense]SKA72348.1 Transcriptional regulator containing PAS, AAA-type ATPase, and DNA-binding Fis domains [Desulfobaculum bizertense DSM 18034]
MLRSIAASLNRIAHVIAIVIGLDVEIVDASLMRIAGTGRYSDGVGKSIGEEGQVYGHALKTGKSVYIDTPRLDPICQGCKHLDTCEEELTMAAPILVDGFPAGVIGIVSFTQEDAQRIKQNRNTFREYLKMMAGMVAAAARDQQRFDAMSETVNTLQRVVDAYSDGVFIFAQDGTLSYVNEQAKREMRIEEEIQRSAVELEETGNQVGDSQEFELRYKDFDLLVMGRSVELGSDDPRFSRMVIFENQKDFTRRMSNFTSHSHSDGLGAILGCSPKIRKLKERVQSIATSSSTVLITGESGTGKELFARAIHKESNRRDQPFIAINCGAIPDTLLESELFGYTSGAFTGARSNGRMGKFELANGGVLFLDEISSMPLYLQVKLLRVLQERTVIRLGSNKLIHVDIRIIAATNDKLKDMIAAHRFRSDLYYRLNVIPFEVPPLRERLEDVDLLTKHFFQKYGKRFGKHMTRMDPSCLERLKSYPWPGNIREFENAIEFIVNMMPSSGVVTPELLPAFLQEKPVNFTEEDGLRPLWEMEREAIQKALQRFGDTTHGKKLAAKRLGIGLATLYRKIQQYEIHKMSQA